MTRRVLGEGLQARSRESPPGEALLDREDAERRRQANVDASRRAARERKTAGASTARKHASAAADDPLRGVEAPAEEKARRRKALVEEAPVVAKARGTRARPRS